MKYKLRRRGLMLAVLAVGLLIFGVGTAVAVFPDDNVATYTGCLGNGGTLIYVKAGDSPSQACSSPKTVVKLSGGDITSVNVNAPLRQVGTSTGLNGAVTIGFDSSYTLPNPSACTSGQVPKWNGTSWNCAADNNTTYTNGTGLDLTSGTFSVNPHYRLPQSCSNGSVAKSDGNGGWACASDSVGTGPNTYFNSNEHVVESFTEWQQVGGLSDLPAGSYVFTTAVHNRAYFTQNGVNSQALLCITLVNGQETDSRLVIPQQEDASDVWAATLPAGSSFIVKCVLRESNGGFFEDDATLAKAHVNALRVGAINP